MRDVTENGRKIGLSLDEGRKLLKVGKLREEAERAGGGIRPAAGKRELGLHLLPQEGVIVPLSPPLLTSLKMPEPLLCSAT